MSIPTEPLVLNAQALQRIIYNFDEPFELQLADEKTLHVEKILRLVPGRRLVALAKWQNKFVVAKIFFDKRAEQHMEKDFDGIKLLREHKIPTPAVLYKGYCRDKHAYVLLFTYLRTAKSLQTIWQERESIEAVLPQLKSVIVELATQHVLGILQHDLHLKNFLLTEKTIFTLDGAQVELLPTLLPKKISMENLALFLSQFGAGVEDLQTKLFNHYAHARGWIIKEDDKLELFLAIKKINEERWHRFEKKIFRDSTDFVRIKQWSKYGVYDRQFIGTELLNFLQYPELIFDNKNVMVLKAGRSSTVIKVVMDNKCYVIKRYNLKSAWHYLRRALRPTRAHKSWRFAQKFALFGIRTAKPVAFLETRKFGLRRTSYYITEFVEGHALTTYFDENKDVNQIQDQIKKVSSLLKSLLKISVTHGDLKATNIIVNNKAQPVLIDLDGAADHYSLSSLHNQWYKELKRFLENFKQKTDLVEMFRVELK